jgi:hypothetical protein
MFQKGFIRIGILASILIFGLLVGCGPSAEEQAATSAALTVAAATDTPIPSATPLPTDTPTPTATPVPYDLSLIVTGEEDASIVGANVILEEVGDDTGTQITDEVGQAFWYDLPVDTVSLSISAQGYFPQDFSKTLERGINSVTLSLERDPHGLLPSQACGPDEKLLYIEDFQDRNADRLETIKFKVGGWDLGPHPDSLGNIVAMYDGEQGSGSELSAGSFDNAVWRFQVMTDSRRIREYSWLIKHYDEGEVETSAYSARFEPSVLAVFRKKWPVSNPALLNRSIYMSPRTWHQIEMITFDGDFEFWVDGTRLLFYEDPEPLPGGTFEIGMEDSPGVVSVDYFDNLSVCELTAPYVPMPTPGS